MKTTPTGVVDRVALELNERLIVPAILHLGARVGVDTLEVHVASLYTDLMNLPISGALVSIIHCIHASCVIVCVRLCCVRPSPTCACVLQLLRYASGINCLADQTPAFTLQPCLLAASPSKVCNHPKDDGAGRHTDS